eukprot:355829-Chlamydomonas_euryale.AAC.4
MHRLIATRPPPSPCTGTGLYRVPKQKCAATARRPTRDLSRAGYPRRAACARLRQSRVPWTRSAGHGTGRRGRRRSRPCWGLQAHGGGADTGFKVKPCDKRMVPSRLWCGFHRIVVGQVHGMRRRAGARHA